MLLSSSLLQHVVISHAAIEQYGIVRACLDVQYVFNGRGSHKSLGNYLNVGGSATHDLVAAGIPDGSLVSHFFNLCTPSKL
jgi:hypothetical protein